MADGVKKYQRPMLYDGQPSTFPTFADQVFNSKAEPLEKDGKWNINAQDVGARPDNWLPTLEEIGGTWKAGDTYTASNGLCVNGFISDSTTKLYLQVYFGKPITAKTLTITSIAIRVRGISGYVDGLSSATDITNSDDYSYSLTNIDKTAGNALIMVTKKYSFGNVSNNTPVSAQLNNFVVEFS